MSVDWTVELCRCLLCIVTLVNIRNNGYASFPEALINERTKINHLKITHSLSLLTSFFVSSTNSYTLFPGFSQSEAKRLRGIILNNSRRCHSPSITTTAFYYLLLLTFLYYCMMLLPLSTGPNTRDIKRWL